MISQMGSHFHIEFIDLNIINSTLYLLVMMTMLLVALRRELITVE